MKKQSFAVRNSTVQEVEPDRLLKVGEVAELIGLSERRTYLLMESRFIPSLKLGTGRNAPIRTPYRALMEWMQSASGTSLPDFLRK